MRHHSSRVLVAHPAAHGEGPVWDDERNVLYWVDLTSGFLHAWHAIESGMRTISFPEAVCAVDPLAGGRFLVALANRVVECDADGRIQREACRIEEDLPGNRCHDGIRTMGGSRAHPEATALIGFSESAPGLFRGCRLLPIIAA